MEQIGKRRLQKVYKQKTKNLWTCGEGRKESERSCGDAID